MSKDQLAGIHRQEDIQTDIIATLWNMKHVLTSIQQFQRTQKRQLGIIQMKILHGKSYYMKRRQQFGKPLIMLQYKQLLLLRIVEVAVLLSIEVVLAGEYCHDDRIHAFLYSRDLLGHWHRFETCKRENILRVEMKLFIIIFIHTCTRILLSILVNGCVS